MRRTFAGKMPNMHIPVRLLHFLLLVAPAPVCVEISAAQGQTAAERDKAVYDLFHTGLQYSNRGEYDSARICLKQALLLPGGKEYDGGRILVNLANLYAFDGHYADALGYYLEGLEIAGKTGKTDPNLSGPRNVIRAMANIAEVYYLMGNLDRALYYAEQAKAKTYAIGESDSYLCPQIFYIIASVYSDRGIPDKAEEYMTKTFHLADSLSNDYTRQRGSPLGMLMYCAYGKEGLARIRLARNDCAGALEYAAEALKYAERHADPMVTAKVLYAFSDIHLAQENYAGSEEYALKALEKSPRFMELNPGLAFNIATAGLFAGNREKAYRFFRAYSGQMKKNTDKQFRETITSMEIQFETGKKELRISNLERQKILYTSAGVAGIALALAIWIILMQKIKNEQKARQLIAANAVLEGEKRGREQIARNLHDGIIGMLSAIRMELATTGAPPGILGRIDPCIEEIRRLANGVMPVSLERYGMKAALEDFSQLYPHIFFHFFGEDMRIDGNMELAVYLCACELTNNSIKHSGATTINIQLIQETGRISLTVEDNGCGYDTQCPAKGAGLQSLRSRVAAFNGKMEIISSCGKGTETTIEFQSIKL
jgi:signal transduction histidine kinase